VIILTDMFGGTPANIGLTFLEADKVEVLTGVNLPMLIKLAGQQKEGTLLKIREARVQVEGKNWEEIAPKMGLEFKSVAEHKKEQYLGVIGESPEIDRLAFSLPIGQISEPVEFAAGYALVKVLERKEASREEFEKNKATELTNFLEARRNRFLQSYIDKLRTERRVRINYGLFMQVNNDILSRYETTE